LLDRHHVVTFGTFLVALIVVLHADFWLQ
jgi:hypothetical protein